MGDATVTVGEDAPTGDTAIPRTIGRYTILRQLGTGGMGIVYMAADPTLDRSVAVKLLKPKLRSREDADHAAARLIREARAMASLSHANVVQVYDAGRHAGRVYIAMELVEGQTLGDWLRENPDAPWRQIVELFVQAGRGLAAAHAAGLLHRDFKAANVLVGDDGRARVLDFGLAKLVGGSESIRTTAPGSDPEPQGVDGGSGLDDPLTGAGGLVGTPGYIAPEALRGATLDERGDQFSFCAALFRALYGVAPYRMSAAIDLAAFDTPPRAPTGHGRPRWLGAIVVRGLQVDPDQRFGSMAALLATIKRRRRGPWRWLAAAVGVAAVVSYGVVATRQPEATPGCDDPDARLADAWSEPQRRALAEKFSEVAAPGRAWETTVRLLDDYAARWVATHRLTCAEAQGGGDLPFDRRMACLTGRRTALRALVSALDGAQRDAILRAALAAADLPPPESCRDDAVLAGRLADPTDASTARAVQVARDGIADAKALAGAGRARDALSQAERAAAAARATGFAPVVVEAQSVLGSVHDAAGHYEDAARLLEDTYWRASGLGHDEVAVAAATKLVYVLGHRARRHDDALDWWRHAQTALERLGDRPVLAARLATNLAAVHHGAGRWREARAQYETALQQREAALGPESLQVASSLNNLANTLRVLEEFDASEKHLRRSLRIHEANLGPDHPAQTTGLQNLGLVLEAKGKIDEAEALYRRAVVLTSEARGAQHPEMADLYNQLAGIANRRGAVAEAREYLERALAIIDATVGNEHPKAAQLAANLGFVLASDGEHATAIEQFKRALAIVEPRWRPDHPKLVIPLQGLGESLLAEERFAEAATTFERAREIAQTQGLDSQLAELEFELAISRWELGDARPDAVAMAEQALERVAEDEDPDGVRVAIEAWLAGRRTNPR